MRIVRRAEFMKLPPGTLYQQAEEPFGFEGLRVKYDSLETDFCTADFNSPENNGSEQLFDRLFDMLERGASYPLEMDGIGRDGLFLQDAIYLIYEREDVMRIRDLLTKILEERE